MQRRQFLQTAASLLAATRGFAQSSKPNIIVILADDIGYGDLSCYGAAKVKTPNLDRIAREGLRFTDAHSSSATCTPTRYSLMTGEYAWRRKGTGILPGNAALIIEPGRSTLPALMRQAGYRTGAVGKWHLGLGAGNIDWNGEIKPGPEAIGFDYHFLIPATGDRTPCVYVENNRVVGLDPKDPIQVSYGKPIGNDPTGKDHPEMLKMKLSHGHDQTIVNGVSRIGYMSGGQKARWVDEDMADTIGGKAVRFIEDNASRPFFLYFATHGIHVPRVPHQRFQGKSACGARCDAILELDATVGRILEVLDKRKLAQNTLLIFTSDNGPVVDDGYADGSVENLNGHAPAGVLKGGKYSMYEGGTRLPLLARWPKRIKPGTSDALFCQVDLTATLGALTSQQPSKTASPDSQNLLPVLLGESRQGREVLVEHANGLALRKGKWKLVPKNPPELYDLTSDLAEERNVAAQHPALVAEMQSLLESIRKGS